VTPTDEMVVRGNRVAVKVHISSQLVTLVHALVSKNLYPTAVPAFLQCQTLATVNHSDVLDGSTIMRDEAVPDCGPADVSSSAFEVPSVIRAHAFVGLGKLCLRDGALAKKVAWVLSCRSRSRPPPLI
jgi:hypothetical protein